MQLLVSRLILQIPNRSLKSIMKKFGVLALMLMSINLPAQAQVLDAISGHTRDIFARFSAEKQINGETLKSGRIDEKAKGQDAIHNSEGTFTLIKSGNDLYLQTSKDFRASLGPDYHIYISKQKAIKDNDEFAGSNQVEVGRLTKPNGASYYKLPTSNPDEVNSALIWCKQFKEYIGSADLK